MTIKGFAQNTRMKPIVTVQVGANVPVGCKNHAVYAESPDTQKCVSPFEGECPYWHAEKVPFGKGKPPSFCPMAGLNDDALMKKGFKTRPTQLGFFLIPQTFRDAMGLPARPTEIPNIVLASHSLEVITDPQSGRVVSVFEPVEAIEEYPILDYNLMWWKKTELVCKGNGDMAHWYPASPDNQNHMKPRKCAYKECPDFMAKGQCKEVGDLFFRVKNSPGFPAMWKFTTRSRKAIEYLLNELRDIHSIIGHVSMIPLKLTLEKEKAHPVMERFDSQTGQNVKTKLETDVYRVHIRTEFTMMGALEAKRTAVQFLMAGDGNELQQLRAATPDVAPDSEAPVEMRATAEPGDIDDDGTIDVPANPPPAAPKPPKAAQAQAAPKPAAPAATAPKPAAPAAQAKPAAPAAAQPTAKTPEKPKSAPDKSGQKPAPAKAKLNLTPEQQKVQFMQIQEPMAVELNNAQSADEMRQIVARYNKRFDEIGRRPMPDDPDTYVIKIYREHMDWFNKQSAATPAATPAPAQARPAQARPAAPAPDPEPVELTKRQQVEQWASETPPFITPEMLMDFFKKDSIEMLSDEEIERLHAMGADVQK